MDAVAMLKEKMQSLAKTDKEWKLYYWPGMPGRGEFMRLLLEETGTPYEDVFFGMDWKDVGEINYQPGKFFFALPVMQHRDLFISQTPVIVRYMAKRLDNKRLYPATLPERLEAETLMAGLVDLVAEGHDAWHPIDKNASYVSQREQAQPFIDYYCSRRLPKWFAFFEAALQRNNEGKEEEEELSFVGKGLSYVDLCAFHVLCGIEFQCGETYAKLEAPLLKRFKEQIGARERIRRYMQSPQRTSFTGTGPLF
ncbi:Glutathione S-transferase [Balamuthia mandrillaris]